MRPFCSVQFKYLLGGFTDSLLFETFRPNGCWEKTKPVDGNSPARWEKEDLEGLASHPLTHTQEAFLYLCQLLWRPSEHM
jgi:hypothetical protein